MSGDALIKDTFSCSHIQLHKYFLPCHCLRKSVVYMLVSSQIRPACPCSTKKGLSCKGSDRPYGVREIHFTNIVLFAAKVSLQQFVSGLTNGHSHPLAGYNNVLNICIQLNLSVLISSISPAYSTETALFSSGDEKEL